MSKEQLARDIKEGRVILFVGAGVSAGLSIPDWRGLIDHMAEELGYDPIIFQSSSGGYLTLAEFYKISKDAIGPLRSWMDTKWNVDDAELRASEVHTMITNAKFDLIYTTNYDRFIERAHSLAGIAFAKVANVRDIKDIDKDKRQIVKFHGDFDDDKTIVLTETDYFERLAFESPLDIKLRSDALGRSILFIGYSLSDLNIRLLLYRLSKMWKTSGFEKYQPKSYLFQSKPDTIQETVLREWGIEVLFEDVDSPGEALTKFLRDITT